MNPTAKSYRISKLHASHKTVNGLLNPAGQALATIAAAAGISQDDAEKKLSLLVDEGLASRTKGSRVTALYAAA